MWVAKLRRGPLIVHRQEAEKHRSPTRVEAFYRQSIKQSLFKK